jgi:hypothetical protein
MFNNAEFLRNARVQLTPRKMIFTIGLTLGLIVIGEILIWGGTAPTNYSPADYSHIKEFGKASFNLLFFSQLILLTAVAATVVGGSMVQEKMRNTLIFQQMTLLSPHEVLLGKMFGPTAIYYLLAALMMPFSIVSAFFGGVSLDSLVSIYAALFLSVLAWQAISLYFSTVVVNASEVTGRNFAGLSYSVGGIAVFFMSIFFNVFWRTNWRMEEGKTFFYGVPISGLALALMMITFIGFWAYIGAVRALKELQLIRLSPKTIWLFFVSLEVLLVGWFWGAKITGLPDNLTEYGNSYYVTSAYGLVIFYLVINMMLLMALAGVSSISRNQLREWWSGESDAISLLKRMEIKNSIINYPVVIGIILTGAAVLWPSISSALVQRNYSGVSSIFLLVTLLAFAISAISMASFIQFCAMFRFRMANQAGVALWVLLVIIAGIATGIFGETSVFALFNPIVFSSVLLDHMSRSEVGGLMLEGILVEILFALISIGFMYWKWRRTRDEMLKNKA